MFRPDSRRQDFNPDDNIGNNDTINNDMMAEIEKELQGNSYDLISLVFLLYEVPDTALQRLIVFQRVSKDVGTSTMLLEWFRHAKHTPTWKHEFVEALLLCQLYSIVKKLGFDVTSARNFYQTDNIQAKMYINPVKKALYKLCEAINAENVIKLKKSLLSYEIDTSEYESCELIFLKLMCDKFITVNQFHFNRKTLGFQVRLDKLLAIIKHLPGLQKLSQDINTLQQSMNDGSGQSSPVAVSTPTAPVIVRESNQAQPEEHLYGDDFKDVFAMLNNLNLEDDTDVKNLKSDKLQFGDDSFEIKNTKRIGVCVILNQVNFHPSKNSIENDNESNLDERIGSNKDKEVIERTMAALKFSVYSATDLNHKEMFIYLKEIIQKKVTKEDSVFMLCILSHGVKGHVYAADSVKVKMDDFQNFLDSDIAVNLHGKPKLLIVQACQVTETPRIKLVADSPNSYTLKKTNFLIYWATAPELEAYRDESKGSIFIQMLCRIILEFVNKEHLCDIFTKVTDKVTLICEKLGCSQVPIYHSTLRKKLYLKMPKTSESRA